MDARLALEEMTDPPGGSEAIKMPYVIDGGRVPWRKLSLGPDCVPEAAKTGCTQILGQEKAILVSSQRNDGFNVKGVLINFMKKKIARGSSEINCSFGIRINPRLRRRSVVLTSKARIAAILLVPLGFGSRSSPRGGIR